MMPPDLPPAPAASTASAQDSSSDKPAPAYISNRGFAPGIILGMLLGLGCTWLLGPIRESNTEPYQLRAEDRYHYMAAIALEYMQRGDLGRAVSKLAELRSPLDPIQAMAAAACELGGGGYLESRGGAAALGAMAVFYQLQGRRGCADRLLPALEIADTKVIQATVPANVDMLAPPPSKTPPLHIGWRRRRLASYRPGQPGAALPAALSAPFVTRRCRESLRYLWWTSAGRASPVSGFASLGGTRRVSSLADSKSNGAMLMLISRWKRASATGLRCRGHLTCWMPAWMPNHAWQAAVMNRSSLIAWYSVRRVETGVKLTWLQPFID